MQMPKMSTEQYSSMVQDVDKDKVFQGLKNLYIK